jgi:hypothetical protein
VSEQPPPEHPDEAAPPTPRWVKVFGGVALAVVVLFLILLVVGGGHGPGRHGLAAHVALGP